jgi:hydrogenase large subunit
VDQLLGELNAPVTALFSTLGRTAARGLETAWAADKLQFFYDRLITNLKSGDMATANPDAMDPRTWPKEGRGVGFMEAPRGSLAHYVKINDGKISLYQCVVPSTWNASPRDHKGQVGAYEASLTGMTLQDPKRPLEALRTIHSFDPCLACATHVLTPEGEELACVEDQRSACR